MHMSPRERIMMLSLYEKVSKYKEYAEKIGVQIAVNHIGEKSKNEMTAKSK